MKLHSVLNVTVQFMADINLAADFTVKTSEEKMHIRAYGTI